MPVQPNLFTKPSVTSNLPITGSTEEKEVVAEAASQTVQHMRPAPVWLQRTSLFVLVMFCIYLGALVVILPWWPRVWDQNSYLLSHPDLSEFLHNGIIRGIISGIGLLDIWIGLSEAIHYRDYRG